jgi:hypothetical protein
LLLISIAIANPTPREINASASHQSCHKINPIALADRITNPQVCRAARWLWSKRLNQDIIAKICHLTGRGQMRDFAESDFAGSESSMRIFHVSEEAGIASFTPRPVPSASSGVTGDAVWAVDEAHLANFILPRDCPRVTYGIGKHTLDEDRARFFAHSTAQRIVAVESRWVPAILACTLYLYEMPPASFEAVLEEAGFYLSRATVAPTGIIEIRDLLGEMLKRNVELRFVPDLWPLNDAVIASTLEFSNIRMRNAAPRQTWPLAIRS